MKTLALALAAVFAVTSAAEARHLHPRPEPSFSDKIVAIFHRASTGVAGALASAGASVAATVTNASVRSSLAVSSDDERIVANPACPMTRFCGCGVGWKVFGTRRPDLDAVSAWHHFPRAMCATGNVAIWSGHVAYIMSCNGDGTAVFYDPNSGGHQTRIHTRELPSLIVDPRG